MILTNRFLLRILQANKMNGNFFSNKKNVNGNIPCY